MSGGGHWGRVVDLSAAIVLAAVWLPLILIGACLAVAFQGFPVFYRARRLGRDSIEFEMLKLRTMRRDADRIGPQVSSLRDPRITRIGRFLRVTKLDEMPQFINVLRGDMAIAGPRPEAPVYLQYYDDAGRESLRVRPGLASPGAIYFYFWSESDGGAQFESRYVSELLPAKLRLDTLFAAEVTQRPLTATVRICVATVYAVFYRMVTGRVPAFVARWQAVRPAGPAAVVRDG